MTASRITSSRSPRWSSRNSLPRIKRSEFSPASRVTASRVTTSRVTAISLAERTSRSPRLSSRNSLPRIKRAESSPDRCARPISRDSAHLRLSAHVQRIELSASHRGADRRARRARPRDDYLFARVSAQRRRLAHRCQHISRGSLFAVSASERASPGIASRAPSAIASLWRATAHLAGERAGSPATPAHE